MDIKYAAGLFDGEGWVRVSRWEKPNSIHIRYAIAGGIGMTYLPVIEALRDQFGGSIHLNRHDLRNPNARIQFTWHIASQIAASFFRKIVSHSFVKREEIELALLLQDDIDKYRHKFKKHREENSERNAIRAYRENIASQIFALKKRSFSPLVKSDPVTITPQAC